MGNAGRPAGRAGFTLHPDLFEPVGEEEFRPRGSIAAAVPVSEEAWQGLVSHPADAG